MRSDSSGFWTGAASFAVSLAIHGTFIAAGDNFLPSSGLKFFQQIGKPSAPSERANELNFEFIEAPPKTRPDYPEKTSKISDRDSLNQNLKPNPEADRKEAPAIPMTGRGDQLAQKRLSAEEQASVAEAAREAQAAQEAQVETQPAEDAALPGEDGLLVVPVGVPEPEKKAQPEREASPAAAAAAMNPVTDPGLTGKDKIDTGEMAKAPSKGARLEGMTSFEATGSGMGAYMKNLKEKVWLKWYPYLFSKFPMDFRTADAVLCFTLDKEGRVRMIRIAEFTGSELFASFSMDAVQKASPFGPLPEEVLAIVGKDELEIFFSFRYA